MPATWCDVESLEMDCRVCKTRNHKYPIRGTAGNKPGCHIPDALSDNLPASVDGSATAP